MFVRRHMRVGAIVAAAMCALVGATAVAHAAPTIVATSPITITWPYVPPGSGHTLGVPVQVTDTAGTPVVTMTSEGRSAPVSFADGPTYTGRFVLAPGFHYVTASVTDAAGNHATSTTRVYMTNWTQPRMTKVRVNRHGVRLHLNRDAQVTVQVNHYVPVSVPAAHCDVEAHRWAHGRCYSPEDVKQFTTALPGGAQRIPFPASWYADREGRRGFYAVDVSAGETDLYGQTGTRSFEFTVR